MSVVMRVKPYSLAKRGMTWETASRSQSVLLVPFNTQVIFHPIYSS